MWWLSYNLMHYGASHSAIYIDPGTHPVRFIQAMIERAPLLLWGQWFFPPVDLYNVLSQSAAAQVWWLAAVFVVILALLLWPILSSNPLARYFLTGFAPLYQALRGESVPADIFVLATGIYATEIERPDERTLLVRPRGGFGMTPGTAPPGEDALPFDRLYLLQLFDTMFRDREQFHPGQKIERTGVLVEVLEVTEDGRPAAASFRFDLPLEDGSCAGCTGTGGRWAMRPLCSRRLVKRRPYRVRFGATSSSLRHRGWGDLRLGAVVVAVLDRTR